MKTNLRNPTRPPRLLLPKKLDLHLASLSMVKFPPPSRTMLLKRWQTFSLFVIYASPSLKASQVTSRLEPYMFRSNDHTHRTFHAHRTRILYTSVTRRAKLLLSTTQEHSSASSNFKRCLWTRSSPLNSSKQSKKSGYVIQNCSPFHTFNGQCTYHRHKKLPQGPPSPPVPIMHSPPRKITVEDQQNWKIPPCISNWKNIKGYTIPLDKRLAADGKHVSRNTFLQGDNSAQCN